MISCPKCKGTVFQTGFDLCKQANVEFIDGAFKVNPINETLKQSAIKCCNCNEQYDLTDEQIVYKLTHPLIKCSKCGKEFTEEELDENNVCTICRVKEMDEGFSELENADQFTLMKMLAQARIDNLNLTKANEKTQQRLERAEELENESEEPKKKRGRKKKEEQVSEQTEEETINIDEDNNDSSDIEISEDIAPDLPTEVTSISNEMNKGVNE